MRKSRAHSVEGVLILDEGGAILGCSAVATQLFGFSADELRGVHLTRLVELSHREEYARDLKSHLGFGSQVCADLTREIPGQRKDGSIVPVQISISEFRPQKGCRFIGIVQDLRTCQDTERRLRQREQELLQIVRHAPTAIATMSAEGRYLSVNQSFCSMLGYVEQELVGKSFLDITHPEDVGESAVYLRRLTQGTIADYRLTKRYLRKDGRIVEAFLHCSLVPDDEDRPSVIIAQVEDLTERLRAEAEAQQHREQLAHVTRLRTVGEMAAGIAHEINQPLSAIATYAQACSRMIQNEPEDGTEILDALTKIGTQAQRAGEVIQRLRTFIRKQEGERVQLEVNDLVREVLKLAETDAREHDVKIIAELGDGLPQIQADRVQIQQVLLNLLRNAMESMREPGRSGDLVVVTTTSSADDVEIAVRDSGAGIPEEIERQLFQPFFTTKSSGLGMGLSISRTIVKSHSGRLYFTRNPERGTTFRVTLPAYLEIDDETI
jgi:two-component system sensor kinase FixL